MSGAAPIAKATAQKFDTTTRASQRLVVAIPVSLSGKTAQGVPFTEITHTVMVNKGGGKLYTTQELAEGTALEVTILATKRTADAQLVWLGKEVGARQEIGVEIEDAGVFWGVQFPEDMTNWRSALLTTNANPAAFREPTAPAGAIAPAPAPVQAPALSVRPSPFGSQLAETLNRVVESALEANLPATVARMGSEISEQVNQVQSNALTAANEQLKTTISGYSEALEMRAIDIVTRNEQELERNLGKAIEEAEQALKRRQQELAQKFAETSRNQMLEAAVSSTARMQQTSEELAGRFTAALDERCQNALSDAIGRLRQRLEGTGTTFAGRLRQAEDELTERLERKSDEVAQRFAASLEQRSEQTLVDTALRLEKHLEETAGRIHHSFMRHLVGELNQQKELWLEEALQALQGAGKQNLRETRLELARAVKQVGEDLEKDM